MQAGKRRHKPSPQRILAQANLPLHLYVPINNKDDNHIISHEVQVEGNWRNIANIIINYIDGIEPIMAMGLVSKSWRFGGHVNCMVGSLGISVMIRRIWENRFG